MLTGLIDAHSGGNGVARKFNGSTQYLIGDHARLNNVGSSTLFATVSLDAAPASYAAIYVHGIRPESAANNITNGVYIKKIGGILRPTTFWEYGAGTNEETNKYGFAFSLNTVYRIACIRDANAKTVRWVINGEDCGTVSYSNNPSGGGSGRPHVGTTTTAPLLTFNGLIADVALYSDAVSVADARRYTLLRQDPRTICPRALLEYWQFGGGLQEKGTRGNSLAAVGNPPQVRRRAFAPIKAAPLYVRGALAATTHTVAFTSGNDLPHRRPVAAWSASAPNSGSKVVFDESGRGRHIRL